MGIAVPGVDDGNAGKAIEILASIDVGDGCTTRLVNHNRDDRFHETSHHVVFVFLDGIVHRCLNLHRCVSSDFLAEAVELSSPGFSALESLPICARPGRWDTFPYVVLAGL